MCFPSYHCASFPKGLPISLLGFPGSPWKWHCTLCRHGSSGHWDPQETEVTGPLHSWLYETSFVNLLAAKKLLECFLDFCLPRSNCFICLSLFVVSRLGYLWMSFQWPESVPFTALRSWRWTRQRWGETHHAAPAVSYTTPGSLGWWSRDVLTGNASCH